MSNINVLELNHVTKAYNGDGYCTMAVNDVTFNVSKGDFIGIMGSSGSGKSTLLNLISTIDKVTSGDIIINGKALSAISQQDMAKFRRENLGFIFQEYNLLDTLTLRENIELALTIQESFTIPSKLHRTDINRTIDRIAGQLNINNILDKFPYQVSGGQRQRCACARAISVNPQLILADEPTGALDSNSAKNLMNTLVSLNKEYKMTILMVTHDVLSASYCEKIYFMHDGKIVNTTEKNNLQSKEYLLHILDVMAMIAED